MSDSVDEVGHGEALSGAVGPSVPGAIPPLDGATGNLGAGAGASLPGALIDSLAGDESAKNIVSARGTEDGLVFRIDGKSDWEEILSEITAFLGTRRRFLEGGQISVEWMERLPTKEQLDQLEAYLQNEYGIAICARRRRPSRTTITVERGAAKGDRTRGREGDRQGADKAGAEKRGVTVSLFDQLRGGDQTSANPSLSGPTPGSSGVEAAGLSGFERAVVEERRLGARNENSGQEGKSRRRMDKDYFDTGIGSDERSGRSKADELDAAAVLDIGADFGSGAFSGAGASGFGEGKKYVTRVASILGEDLHYEEDANAKIFFGTLRSGQRVETPFSLVVVGDVNPGADLVAGGDIIVLGSLRGTAHAAAYDDDCQDRVIFAMQMQPMQLRIGSVISRGSGEAANTAEIARVENRRIVVEAFQPRGTNLGRGPGAKKLR